MLKKYITKLMLFYVYLITVCKTSAEELRFCEDESRTISCDNGKVLSITNGFYGRHSYSTECGSWYGWFTCWSVTAYNFIFETCNNKSQCNLTAADSIYGDPCLFYTEYLDVSYNCVNATEVPLSPSPPPMDFNSSNFANFSDSWLTSTIDPVTFTTKSASTINDIGGKGNETSNESDLSQNYFIYIGVGVIAAGIAILILVFSVRICRKKSSRQEFNQVSQPNLPSNATSLPSPNNVYDYASDAVPNDHMVGNELYLAADANDYDQVIVGQEGAIYSIPNKRRKPEMTDNELYNEFDG